MLKELTDNRILENNSYLGPARIVAIQGRRVQLECPDEFPWAQMALAHAYEAAEGDMVLAIGRGNDWYVIGLLEGKGKTSFTAPGDVELHAPNGKIDLMAGAGVHITSPNVEITASRLGIVARDVLQRFVDVTQWVTGTLHRRIGRMSTKVESDYHLKAERIVERADGDVILNGKMINLN